MADQPLKSAYELAMERLNKRDREEGVEQEQPLTADQKKEIARLRQEAQAKLAEIEILHRKQRSAEADPEKLAKLDEHYQTDRRRVESRLESAIARVKRGD
jgi:septal ring factor EnvC (AmiA/AmiB activator)